jgi:anti-sigma B factor antagonist
MGLHVNVEDLGDRQIVQVQGDVDMSTAGLLDSRLQELVASGTEHLVVDLSECRYFDSEGIKVLIRAHNALGRERGRIAISGAQGTVLRVFRISGLDTVFQVIASTDEMDQPSDG